MGGVYVERWSNSAMWCQRFALFLLPYFVVVILLYRFDKIETNQLFALIGVGFMLALVALILAFRAISELWSKGYRGGSMVIRGLVAVLVVLLPFGYYAYLALQFPLANDVATDAFNPPDYITAVETREQLLAKGGNPVGPYDRPHSLEIITAYPKLQPRRYPAGPERVLEAVRTIIQENEWPITGSLGLPEVLGEATTETELADNEQANAANDEGNSAEEAMEVPDDIFLEFLERTPVLAFENDVVVRIISEDQNTLVDVRASSRWGRHDFGYNARLIERFLAQLDANLLGIAGEG